MVLVLGILVVALWVWHSQNLNIPAAVEIQSVFSKWNTKTDACKLEAVREIHQKQYNCCGIDRLRRNAKLFLESAKQPKTMFSLCLFDASG